MKNTALIGILTALITLAAPMGRAQVTLEIDPAIDQSKVDFDLWNRVVVSIHDRLTHPYPFPSLKIRLGSDLNRGGCGAIWIVGYPRNRSDLSDAFYRVLTHEYSHASRCPFLHDFLEEGFAEAERHLTYRELARTMPGIAASTDVWQDQMTDNLIAHAVSGTKNYTNNTLRYSSLAGKFELLAGILPGRNFNAYYEALGRLRPQTLQEHLAVLDVAAAGKKINGVSPSTFFLKSPVSFLNKPDGDTFGIRAFAWLENTADWVYTNTMIEMKPSINPTRIYPKIRGQKDGIAVIPSRIAYRWEVTNALGNIVASGHSTNGQAGYIDTTNFPFGVYRLIGGITNADGSYDPALKDTSYFVVYRGLWEKGKLFIIANGPNYSGISDATRIDLVNPDSRIVTERYPGLLVTNLNGTAEDIRVTDNNGNIRTFTPDWEVSQFVYFTDRSQPHMYAVSNGASFEQGPLVPGEIVSIFGWGMSHHDPQFAITLPLPTMFCMGERGRTRVVFTANGREYEAPFFYGSRDQLNVQVPWELAGSNSATVKVVVNESESNALTLPIATADPGIFVINWQTRAGAVLAHDGYTVSSNRPANMSETLSLYATGLGAVDSTLATNGMPAPNDRLYRTVETPIITIDGIYTEVTFSGLAPGFVGLYQVNFVPENLAPGIHELKIEIGGKTSNAVMLNTQ